MQAELTLNNHLLCYVTVIHLIKTLCVYEHVIVIPYSYKSRLMRLNLLPLMYIYDLNDIMLFINSVKSPSDKFNILEFTFGTTRSAGLKLKHNSASTNNVMNSYFYRIPRLWNSIPVINLSYPLTTIKLKLKKIFLKSF